MTSCVLWSSLWGTEGESLAYKLEKGYSTPVPRRTWFSRLHWVCYAAGVTGILKPGTTRSGRFLFIVY